MEDDGDASLTLCSSYEVVGYSFLHLENPTAGFEKSTAAEWFSSFAKGNDSKLNVTKKQEGRSPSYGGTWALTSASSSVKMKQKTLIDTYHQH